MAVYARILRSPSIAVLIVATTIGRLPFAINGLAVVLFLRDVTGSFAIAGLTTGMLALGSALGAPLAGRLVDRRGVRLVLPLAFVHAAALLGIWALGAAGAATVALAATAFVAGSVYPPTGAVLRSRWPELLREPELIRGAYAFDSAMIEVSFVSGPLITAAIVATAGAEVALGVSAGLVIAGAALFLSALPGDRGPIPVHARASGALGALSEPALRMIALTTLPVGFCIGTVEVAVPAFSDAHGSPALAGILLALWSVASGIGGLVFGLRSAHRGLVETYVVIAVLFPIACLPLAAASSPAVMALLVILAGAPIAPLIASRNELVAAVARRGTGTESFTWLLTALVAGLSAGAAVAGAVIEAHGWPTAVLVGCAVAALGAVLAVTRRDALRPAPGDLAAPGSAQPRLDELPRSGGEARLALAESIPACGWAADSSRRSKKRPLTPSSSRVQGETQDRPGAELERVDGRPALLEHHLGRHEGRGVQAVGRHLRGGDRFAEVDRLHDLGELGLRVRPRSRVAARDHRVVEVEPGAARATRR